MTRFYEPDLTVDANSPFVREASHKLVRRAYWMDMTDPTLLMKFCRLRNSRIGS